MNSIQEAKSRGGLLGISLKDLHRSSVIEAELAPKDYSQCACGFPNAADVEIADTEIYHLAHYLNCDQDHAVAIRNCHRGLSAESGGSWGHCTSKYEGYYSVEYGVDVDSFPSHYHRKVTQDEIRSLSEGSPWWGWSFDEAMSRFDGKSVLDVCLLVGVEETYRLAGVAHVRVESKPRSGIWIRSRNIPGTTIGIGWFPGAGCRSLVEFHIDSSWNPSLHPRIGLFGHEDGHCNNLPHTFRGQATNKGVMSYTSKFPYEGFSTGESSRGFTLPRDHSWDRLENFYEPRPVPSDNAPIPPGPTPPGERPSEQEFSNLQRDIRKQLATFRSKHYTGNPPIIWT